MSEILARYRLVADDLSARVAAVPDSAWSNPSPCEDWTAHQVMDHVVGNHRALIDRLNGDEHVEATVQDVDAEWAAARASVEAVLADPARAKSEVAGPAGPMPFEVFVGRFAVMDMLIHTWDIAKATGGDEKVNEEIAGHALEGLRPMDAMLRRPGLFGPAVEPPPGADVVTQLMAFCGRQV